MKKIAILATSIFLIFSGLFLAPVDFAYATPSSSGTSVPPTIVDGSIERAINVGCGSFINSPFSNCVLWFVYTLILQPSFTLLGFVAGILDFFLGYSLDSNSYTSLFIEKGWALIRDISNVAFIFTLLYLSIRHILGMSAKKAIPTLIIVALLLNFSLFFTRVVIDAGNILARAFYKSIVIENDPNYANTEGYKSISLGLVDKVNPQTLLSDSLFKNVSNFTGDFDTSQNAYSGTVTPSLDSNMGYTFLIFFLVIAVNLTMAWVFLSVALLFVGRVIGLWFMMIFSPIAFITLAVPGSGGFLKQLSFDSWKDTVIKLSFVAPVFIFFLYLIISFLTIVVTSGANSPSEGASIFTNLMKVFIPFIFIIMLLQVAKKTAESMAGEFGAAVKSMVGKVAGVAAGGALGASSFALRATAGRLASAKLSSGNYNERMQNARDEYANATDGAGRALASAKLKRLELTKEKLESWKNSSWDIRNASKSKMFGGLVGGAAGIAGKGIGMGMTGFGGQGFTAGSGSNESRSKYEKEEESKRLAKASEVEKVGRNEFTSIIDRQLKRGDKKDDMIKTVDKTIGDLGKSIDGLTVGSDLYNKKVQERDQAVKLKENMENAVDNEQLYNVIKNGATVDSYGTESSYDSSDSGAWAGTTRVNKKKSTERRNSYADEVERSGWYNAQTGENEYTADKIRSGKTSKSKAETMMDAIKKAMEDDEKNNPPPPAPSPATP